MPPWRSGGAERDGRQARSTSSSSPSPRSLSALRSYSGLDAHYAHEVVDHAETYVDGRVHTNRMENFWSLLKRGLRGTYISVEPVHLFRYLDERTFTLNHRDFDDLGRFEVVLGTVSTRRLTFAEATGKA